MATVESCTTAINVMIVVSIIVGLITGYYYYSGDKQIIFIPMVIGFICVWILYYFIEKKEELKTGKKVDKY